MLNVKTALRYLLTTKKVKDLDFEWKNITVPKKDVVFFVLSSNPVMSFFVDGKQYYFKECIPKETKKQFVQTRIELFFQFVDNNEYEKINFGEKAPIETSFRIQTIDAFRSYINALKDDKLFVRKMLTMHKTLSAMRYSIWADNNKLSSDAFSKLGLRDLPHELFNIAIYFVWYMRSMSNLIESERAVFGKRGYYYSAVRSIATYIVAQELGVEALVTQSTWCKLRIDDNVFWGVLSEAAPGTRAKDAEYAPSGILQRDLLRLNVLDAICFQQDHAPNNYNVAYCNSEESMVCAFDNDNPNTFFTIGTIDWKFAGCTSLVSRTGLFNRPYMDYSLANNILSLDFSRLKSRLTPYLNRLQIASLRIRIEKMNRLINCTRKKNQQF